jgi:glycosyltransferase involved in cell wall biosynthesis
MRILFLTPYFPPEVGAAQTRIYELALRLQQMGHQVAVLTTFPSYPSGVVSKQWRRRLCWKGVDQGMTVYRVWSYAAPNRGFLKRILSHLSFAFFASLGGMFLPRCDAIVVESPPLFDGFAGVFLNAVKGAPYLFMVSDLWPETAVQMGMLRSPFLIWAARKIELLFYRRAAAVLALTAGIQAKIGAAGIDGSKVVLFRNSVDCEFFRPGLHRNGIRHELGIGDQDFVAVYSGTFGLAQNLTTVLESAALFQTSGNKQVRFLFVGDGAEADILKSKALELALSNVTFVEPMPKKRMPELLNAADCVLVPLRNLEIFRGALPTKMFEAMACAKPAILGIAGEAEELMREAGAGYYVVPEDPIALYDAVLQLMKNPADAQRMGERGREYVVLHFSRDARAQQLSDVLTSVLPLQSGTRPAISRAPAKANSAACPHQAVGRSD